MGNQEYQMDPTNQNTQNNPHSQIQIPLNNDNNNKLALLLPFMGHGFADKKIGKILNLTPSSNVPFSLESPNPELLTSQ